MKQNHVYLLKQYNLDIVQDVLSKKDKHVEFVFDMQEKPINIYIIKGDVTLIGLKDKTVFDYRELLQYVETDNALSEIEGKKTFLQDLLKKIISIKDDLYVFIPLKSSNHPIWLTIGFYTLLEDNHLPKLIHGKIHRVSKEIPLEITYYKKAYQDELTGLFTRETLKLHFEKSIERNNAYGMYIDLDRFKMVNDQYGHKMGNIVLKMIAQAMINQWEKNVIYYRLGGDEFFVYVWDHTHEALRKRAEWLINTIENLMYKEIKFDISASIGIVPIHKGCTDYSSVLDMADEAMYQVKRSKTGQYIIMT